MKLLLDGDSLRDAIYEVLAAPKPCCAVAFWGRGAAEKVITGKGARLICNLASGGTNPHEIEKLIKHGCDVRQNDRLHAKVYIGGGRAVITSANLSANGLGLEGDEVAHWREAGVVTSDVQPVAEWFDELWSDSDTRKISNEDLKKSKKLWEHRRSAKPSLRTFADFDPENADFPLLEWWRHSDYEINENSVKKQTGFSGKDADNLIQNSTEITSKEDELYLKQGQWILLWPLVGSDEAGYPGAGKFQWALCTGKPVRKAFKYTGEKEIFDVVTHYLDDTIYSRGPFNCNDSAFRVEFKKVMSKNYKNGKYKNLLSYNRYERGEPSLSRDMVDLMHNFWRDLKFEFTRSNGG